MVLHPEQFNPDQFQRDFVRDRESFGVDFSPKTVQIGRTVRPALLPTYWQYANHSPVDRNDDWRKRGFVFRLPHESGLISDVHLMKGLHDTHPSVWMSTDINHAPYPHNRFVSTEGHLHGGNSGGGGTVDDVMKRHRFDDPEVLNDIIKNHVSSVEKLVRSGKAEMDKGPMNSSTNSALNTPKEGVMGNWMDLSSPSYTTRRGLFLYGSNRYKEL